jgi:hypothetical protein
MEGLVFVTANIDGWASQKKMKKKIKYLPECSTTKQP